MKPEDQRKGIGKIVTGLILMVVGGIGLVFGRNAKQRTLRVSILVLSTISLGSGFYLFVDGVSDYALGVVGHLQLDKMTVEGMARGEIPVPKATYTVSFTSPKAFEKVLKFSIENDPALKDLRRLEYFCGDGSEGFTVYNTVLGLFGIPQKSVKCADGTLLVKYDYHSKPSWGFREAVYILRDFKKEV